MYFKIVLVVFGLAYLISPVDIIPDLLVPYLGFLDDGAIIATLIYLIRTGKLPNFLFKPHKKGFQNQTKTHQGQSTKTDSQNQQNNTQRSTQHSNKSACDILGVPPGATQKQIQTAYKKAIKKYHPDKLSHLGEEFSTLANEKFLEIQTAYDDLMKKFNT